MNELQAYHVPVLLKESIDGLNIRPEGIYVDATFGGGGHSKAILKRLDGGRLYGFDQDEDAEKNILPGETFTFIRSNFRYLSNFMDWQGVKALDGLLADLGVSSHHFDDETRGFSFRFEGELDMRMNRRAGKTAADILNTYTEEALADVFYLYGELRNSRAIAKAIVRARNQEAIRTISGFLQVIKPFFGWESQRNRSGQKEKKNLAQAFQALRIEVNGEMDALKDLLIQALDLLKPGGRLVVITYHSLEDRLVKNFFKTGNFEGIVEKDFYGNVITPFRTINNKVLVPDSDEIEKNPRARSAKLRIVEKNGNAREK
ncbi:MAG: 16S rRNA (cytosine(1402)-N(4))-methyltransferase RsmH [Dysgonamonadaceae bacterium]|jgi:16S rRNA (cytosine1402-N4)-methyltransferase|nr:16S rRNA (cytosine(1402)-N(4))-methyltransferase RsmH [Dysgonamonadaceae bacterium]